MSKLPDAFAFGPLALLEKSSRERLKKLATKRQLDVGEMLIKIKVAGWSGEARPLDQLENWKPTRFARGEVFDCLVSLRADLRRMQAAPPRRALRRPERVEAAPSR